MLWALFTVIAAAGQTARNATQRDLTAKIGTVGATQVRFLFGFPFGVLFFLAALAVTGEAMPGLTAKSLIWALAGGVTQILATGLMLKAMASRSFVVTTAYTKTEPVQVALFGLIFLGDHLTPMLTVAILMATSGVMLLGWPARRSGEDHSPMQDYGPALIGIVSGGFFALSAIGYRGAIHALDGGGTWVRASMILALGLGLQTALIITYLLIRDRTTLRAILGAWKPSVAAGFLGAAASQFWFLGFALTSAARVRTLGLVEVLFAYAISGRVFNETMTRNERIGLLLVVFGVALSLNA